MYQVLDGVYDDVLAHIPEHGRQLVGTEIKTFFDPNHIVTVVLRPSSYMTWTDWGTVPVALSDWIEEFDCVELDFDVKREDVGAVGEGFLRWNTVAES